MRVVTADTIARAIMTLSDQLAVSQGLAEDCLEAGAPSSAISALVETQSIKKALEILNGLPSVEIKSGGDDDRTY